MKFQYKIAVLGPIPRDHITTYRGEVIEKYGGINNPVIALAKLLDEELKVIPVTHIRKKDVQPIKEILSVYPNIDLNHINSKKDQGDIIRLRFISQDQRLEKQSGFMNPIIPDDVKNLLDCDAFVIVPVTDFEVSLETLKFIKSYSDGLVLFDAHGPTNITTTLGDRLMKFWVDRDNWIPHIDILKMNLEEARCCWYRKKYQLTDLENEYELSENDLSEFAQHCLNKGVKAICITLDQKGCIVYFSKNGTMHKEHVAAMPVDYVIDTTGCGDSFAAGFAFGALIEKNYVKAAQYANALGALRTQGKDFDIFKSYPEVKQMITETYGE